MTARERSPSITSAIPRRQEVVGSKACGAEVVADGAVVLLRRSACVGGR